MTDPIEAHQRCLRLFGEKVRGVPDDAWDAPTPCADWDVRDLVNHNVAENRWAGDLLAGRTIADVGERHEGDLLEDDPVAAYAASAEAARVSTEAEDVLEQDVHVSYGPISGAEYLTHRWVDLLVHSWDLAVATGQDATLPADLAEFAVQAMRRDEEAIRSSGAFGDRVQIDEDRPAQDHLVALLGRDPDW